MSTNTWSGRKWKDNLAPYLSVVIPAYEEVSRIRETLGLIQDYLERMKFSYEIILVDDGSKDETAQVAQSALRNGTHQILVNHENRGKGFSVRRGVLAASGKYILFTDADLSTPIQELERFVPFLEDGYDVVIGSRAVPDPLVKRKMIWYREIMGRTYNLMIRLVLVPGITDTQCGFKCFKSEAAHDLFSRQKLDGFSFDGEVLYLARKSGYRVKELPVHWYAAPGSKVKVLRDSLVMFFDIVRIRLTNSFL